MTSCGRDVENVKKRLARLGLIFVVLSLCACLLTAFVACDGKDDADPPASDGDVGSGSDTPSEGGPQEGEEEKPELKTFDGVTFEDESVVYDGEPHIIEPKGAPFGTRVTYLYEDFVDVGEYQVVATLELSGYKAATFYATLTILPATVEVSFTDATFVWDGAPHNIYVIGALPDGAIVTYECGGETKTGAFAATDVGTYTVTAHITLGKNYVPVGDLTATLTIKNRAYVVSFVHWDGTVETREVYRGYGLPETQIPANKPREGYSQMLWDPEDIALLKNVTKDITVHEINGEAQKFEVILDPNGGIVSIDKVEYKYEKLDGGKIKITYTVEDDIELVEPLNFDGQEFLGWYDEKGDRVTRLPDVAGPRNMILTARWKK